MSNPIITFRLSPYQLARGLQIVRALEPSFQLTSLSQLVKIIYTDYLAKMTLGQSGQVDPNIMKEIKNFIILPKKREINLSSLADDEENLVSLNKATLFMPLPSDITESDISVVTDFSPPTDWMDDEDELNEEEDEQNE